MTFVEEQTHADTSDSRIPPKTLHTLDVLPEPYIWTHEKILTEYAHKLVTGRYEKLTPGRE